jgi:hypothetical protein
LLFPIPVFSVSAGFVSDKEEAISNIWLDVYVHVQYAI